MKIILADAGLHIAMKPLTWVRSVAEMRTGILTSVRRWEMLLNTKADILTEDFLQKKYPLCPENENLVINAGVLPTLDLVDALKKIKKGSIVKNGKIIAAISGENEIESVFVNPPTPIIEFPNDLIFLEHTWDIFTYAGEMIKFDFNLLTVNRKSENLSSTNIKIGENPVFVEKGAIVEASVLNTTNGPIYIGKDAEVMEGCQIRGPFAMCEHSVVKMGAKIYGPTCLGPHVKVGGEVNNVVFFGYANKAHDGFLGNAVIGEWCNIGADTNNSNLKNNYAEVKMWDYETHRFAKTGLQFCGLIMGDHSKTGINTMFNTGTVVGVCCNLFGSGFPRNYVPSFAWGGASGYSVYGVKKAISVSEIVMKRRNLEFQKVDREIIESVFEKTANFRNFN